MSGNKVVARIDLLDCVANPHPCAQDLLDGVACTGCPAPRDIETDHPRTVLGILKLAFPGSTEV